MAYRGTARPPDCCGIHIADVLTGTYAFGAIMAALYQRQANGQGQMIDVSMLEAMLSRALDAKPALQHLRRDAAVRPGVATLGEHTAELLAEIG